MKKFILLMVSAVAVLALSGCGSSNYYDDYDEEIRYHLVDQDGYGVSDIRYTCDGGTVEVTDGSGGFYFYPNNDCSLQLDITVDSTQDDLYIENNAGRGVSNIPYECTSGLFGRTDRDGHFEFDNVYSEDNEDICTFQL